MQFLKTLLWVVIAVSLAMLARGNWNDVTLALWGDIQVDIKVPVLIALTFLVGWLPTYLIYRAKSWRLRNRVDSLERQQAMTREAAPQVDEAPAI
jgi:lipopolysaccharide assembly protein A